MRVTRGINTGRSNTGKLQAPGESTLVSIGYKCLRQRLCVEKTKAERKPDKERLREFFYAQKPVGNVQRNTGTIASELGPTYDLSIVISSARSHRCFL